ncbi:MAG: hypothetical protein WDW36_003115 [Sanguina aurantia]
MLSLAKRLRTPGGFQAIERGTVVLMGYRRLTGTATSAVGAHAAGSSTSAAGPAYVAWMLLRPDGASDVPQAEQMRGLKCVPMQSDTAKRGYITK